MHKTSVLQFILLFFLVPLTIAQNKPCRIYGRVTDSVSLKPIADVSVFVPFTSRGTITNSNGEYSLNLVPEGELILGFRHVSYAPRTFEALIKKQDSIQLDVVMSEVVIEINEVIKEAGKIDRSYGLLLLKELLLGDVYETSCILKNPKDLFFYSDGDIIYGQSRQPMKITNTYLGYDITYYLDYFKFDRNRNPVTGLGGNEFFTFGGLAYYADKGANARVKKTKWIKNRAVEFQGTLRCFLHDLYLDSVKTRKFYLREVLPEGPDSIFHWDTGQLKGRYLRYSREKEFSINDSVLVRGPGPIQRTLILPGPMLVFFDNLNTPDRSDDRACLLEVDRNILVFDNMGNWRTVNGSLNWVFLDNRKRLRNMLPLDYEPSR